MFYEENLLNDRIFVCAILFYFFGKITPLTIQSTSCQYRQRPATHLFCLSFHVIYFLTKVSSSSPPTKHSPISPTNNHPSILVTNASFNQTFLIFLLFLPPTPTSPTNNHPSSQSSMLRLTKLFLFLFFFSHLHPLHQLIFIHLSESPMPHLT